MINGKTQALLGVAFNRDDLHHKILGNLTKVFLMIIGDLLFVLILLQIIIYRRAARPITSIQSAVRGYMTEKDSGKARSDLNGISSANEVGVLAGDVDEMIAQIDEHIDSIEKAGVKFRTLTKEVMEALASAIDAKDRYTHGHSSRVADYSRKLAEMAGMSDEECEEVYYSALLHDVGKIGIPSRIINKESRLDDEEYETIKTHPALGAQILATISEFPYLSIAANYHHERYDGRGYPHGLKGEERSVSTDTLPLRAQGRYKPMLRARALPRSRRTATISSRQ